MSDYKPITGELRDAMCQWGWVEKDGSIIFTTSPTLPSIDAEQSLAISGSDFDRLCDEIDAIHAGLERENAELRERLAEMDNRGGSMHIGEATVTVKPVLDWSGVAHELRAIADTLAGDAE